jgi:hypothetical protein
MRRIFVIALGLLPFVAGAASAKSLCGAAVQQNVDEVRTFLGHFFAACEDGGACRAMTYQKVKDSGVPWTHRLAVHRSGKDAPWVVELTIDKGAIDVSEGYELVIDRREPLRVPPEAIKVRNAQNDYLVNDDLNEVLVKELAGGGNVVWKYVNAEDKSLGSAAMSLAGMRKAMRWISCVQKKL